MKICVTCGEKLSNEAKFCPIDGTALAGATTGASDEPAPQFAKTLYGAPAPSAAAPPEGASESPSPDAGYDDLPASTSVDVVSSTKARDVDVQVTPSSVAVVKDGEKKNDKKKDKKKKKAAAASSASGMTARPKSPFGLAVVAALGGAAFVGILAFGVKMLRGPGKKPAVVASAEQATPAAPTTRPAPTPPAPTTPQPAEAIADAAAAKADAAAPTSATSGGEPATPDAGKPEEPEPSKPEPEKAATEKRAEREKKKTQPPSPPTPPPGNVDPKQAEIYIRAGEEHLKRGSYAKAEAAFEQARAYNPNSAAALAGLGEVAFEQGNYVEATGKLRAAVRLDRNSRYLTLLGNSYFKQKKYRQAIEQYKRALKLSPGNTEASEGMKAAQTKLRGG